MHAVVVNVSIKDRPSAEKALHEQVVPRVSQAPGFVGGFWIATAQDKGFSVIAFENEEVAKAAAAEIQPPGDMVEIDSVEVYQVVANA
jgi:hypothetical protein